MSERVTVRLAPEQATKLAEMAAAASCSMAQVLRRLIDAADGVGEGTVEPLDIEGVRRLLYEQARRGSVPAVRANGNPEAKPKGNMMPIRRFARI